MIVQDISISKAKAAEFYDNYWNQVNTQRTKEDEQIARAYKAAAQGYKLIDLAQSIQKAGAGDGGLPKLAIARASETFVYYRNFKGGNPTFTSALDRWKSPDFNYGIFYRTILPGVDLPKTNFDVYKAMVPIVPPQFRPKFKLSNYHILFEAVWTKEPPRDPFLLKHCGGSIYIVLAEWDLTEIERSVMYQRLI